MAEEGKFKEIVAQAPNRRSFVTKLGLATAAVAASTKMGEAQSSSGSANDIAILNFALNLEFLEAEFYTVATTGMTVDQFGVTISGTGTGGTTTNGIVVPFSDPTVRAIAQEIAADERTHVALLQGAISTLGGQAIAKPAINLNALGFGFSSQSDFLKLARILEDIGVSAYGGAAPLIATNAILATAARILAAEAEHVGNIRLLVAQNQVATTAFDGADITPPPSGTEYFSLNSMAISEVRTPQQVLYVAYGGKANATSGGFFPNGVNGSLNTSSASAATLDGSMLTANPNPISLNGSQYGQTTITWNAPSAQFIQVRVGSPTGGLLTTNFNSGSMATGQWVTDGMMFFLQDVSNGKALTAANTLAILVVHAK